MKAKKKSGTNLTMLSMFATSALTLAIPLAHATQTDWGIHDTVETGFGTPSAGSFIDLFSFTLPLLDSLASATAANNLTIGSTSQLHISNGLVQLFQGTYGDATPDILKLSYSFDGTTGSTSHTLLSGLSTGPAYYEITGEADGAHGGVYTLTSAFISAVPEPDTYGMLLAGLGLMGLVVRRRTKIQN